MGSSRYSPPRIDLSHLNEAGFWDVAGLEPGPLVASHSGAHSICPASRNLTDRQLDAIGTSGGLVGIVFATPFLRPDFADDPETRREVEAICWHNWRRVLAAWWR